MPALTAPHRDLKHRILKHRIAPQKPRTDPVTPKGGQDGRGNLRENREDPAPTVGVVGDIIALQTMPINAQTPHGLCSDVACRVMIKNSPALCRREPHFYQLARLATAILVGAVPSVASAPPNSAASRPKNTASNSLKPRSVLQEFLRRGGPKVACPPFPSQHLAPQRALVALHIGPRTRRVALPALPSTHLAPAGSSVEETQPEFVRCENLSPELPKVEPSARVFSR